MNYVLEKLVCAALICSYPNLCHIALISNFVASTGQTAPSNTGDGPGKRYLIVSYTAEFDHVHYPLPLKHEAAPDPARLKALVCSLRAELDSTKGVPRPSVTPQSAGDGADLAAEAAAARREAERATAECAGLEEALGKAAHENKKLRQLVRAISLVRVHRRVSALSHHHHVFITIHIHLAVRRVSQAYPIILPT